MSDEEFVRVGKVKDAHGIKGELFLLIFAGEASWLDKLENIRLVAESGEGEPTILTIKSVRWHKNGIIAKTNEVHDRNAAEDLKGLMFEIPASFLVSEKGEQIYLREVLGFGIFTAEKGRVGKVVKFGNNGAQDLLIVETEKGEYDIPFVDAFVEKIDYEKGEIHMDLPYGLLGELEDEEQ